MLSIALAATLVGFALLVVALVTSKLALAITCVAVCVVGLILLLVDTIRANRRGHGGVDDDPLFTIRGRESAAREEPLDDRADDSYDDDLSDEDHPDADLLDSGDADAPDSGPLLLGEAEDHSSLGSVVVPPAEQVHDDDFLDSAGNPVADPGAFNAGGFQEPAVESNDSGANAAVGDVNDYLRSTGSFPIQPPAAVVPPSPVTAPQQAPVPQQLVPPVQAPQAQAPQAPAPQAPQTGPTPTGRGPVIPGQYVGRRRLAEDPTENIVVRSSSPDLPAMQFVWEDPSDIEPESGGKNT